MANKPSVEKEPIRRILNERGETVKSPTYAAPPNPTKSTINKSK